MLRSTSTVLDATILLERCLGEPDVARQVLDQLERALPGEVRSLTDACTSAHFAEAAPLAHRVRGSAAQVGAQDLANSAAQLEQLLLQGRAGAADAELRRLGAHSDRVLRAIQQVRSELNPPQLDRAV